MGKYLPANSDRARYEIASTLAQQNVHYLVDLGNRGRWAGGLDDDCYQRAVPAGQRAATQPRAVRPVGVLPPWEADLAWRLVNLRTGSTRPLNVQEPSLRASAQGEQ